MEEILGTRLLELVIAVAVAYLLPKALESSLREAVEPPSWKRVDKKLPLGSWCGLLAVGGGVAGAISATLSIAGLGAREGLGSWPIFCSCIGVSQWLVLRRHWRIGPSWAVLSSLAGVVWFQPPVALGDLSVGALVGGLQWLILRSHKTGAAWWIPTNAIAWPLASFVAFSLGILTTIAVQGVAPAFAASSSYFIVTSMLGWGIRGLLGGALLWAVLTRLPPRES